LRAKPEREAQRDFQVEYDFGNSSFSVFKLENVMVGTGEERGYEANHENPMEDDPKGSAAKARGQNGGHNHPNDQSKVLSCLNDISEHLRRNSRDTLSGKNQFLFISLKNTNYI
jgi:hypothetical protein